MKRLLPIAFVFLFSCQEQITPIIKPITDGGNTGGNTGGGTTDCTISSFTPVPGKYASCFPLMGDETFDIVTWNIEQFPKSGNTIPLVAEIIQSLNADIIALQEINSASAFNTLKGLLPGWDGFIPKQNNSLQVGYLYKTAEISISGTQELFTDDASSFPRPAYVTTATHVSGKSITLINLHLKCCDDGNSIERRRTASQKLKNHIDTNLSSASVVVLGDFNEDITEPEGNGVFNNFKEDSNNYRFANMNIAMCSSENWSYPSWPSHLDHILITNELFSLVEDVRTLKVNACESQYYSTVSDHRPVMLRLNP